MKKISNTLKSLALLTLITFVTIACDKDFTNIDSDIQGIKNFTTASQKFPVVSYSRKITDNATGIQANGLPGNLLGIYNDPNSVYGTTEAGIVAQISPINFNPSFGENVTLESVTLTVPYFASIESTETNGNNIYKADSIFGNPESTFKLSIYRSNYLLRNLDPNTNFEEAQAYYSSQEDLFCAQIGELLYQDNDFTPSFEEIRIQEVDEDGDPVFEDDGTTPVIAERIPPSLRVELLNPGGNFWQNLIFANEENDVLSNTNNFNEFFRGLIFKVEANTGEEGNMQMLNLTNSLASIVLDYTNQEQIDNGGEEDVRNPTAYRLAFGNGIKVNTINNDFVFPVAPNPSLGDDNLLLKGGDGSMAVIELFNGTVDDEGVPVDAFTYFKNKEGKWIVNEANLVFYVNQDDLNGNEPNRLLLYDLKNNTPLLDYYLDGSVNTAEPTKSKIDHSVILERDTNEKGIRYKFRLTEHINSLLIRDSTNVKIGLYVANNVNNVPTTPLDRESVTNSRVQDVTYDFDDSTTNSFFPSTSLLSTRSTILHGSKLDIPEGKRVEFEIFYTDTETEN
jgi:hypothetical protein